MRRNFKDLSAQEVLALAISLEEEDAAIFREFARLLRPNFPKAAASLDDMCAQEDGHRRRLIDMFRKKFGEEIPLVRRQDVRGFVRRDPVQSLRVPGVDGIRRRVALMELETARYYEKAAQHAKDAELRQLLGDLAEEERKHEETSATFDPAHQPAQEREEEARTARQLFVLQVVQPGLAGLMDGSVSTLAPLFATSCEAFLASFKVWNSATVGGIPTRGADDNHDRGTRGHLHAAVDNECQACCRRKLFWRQHRMDRLAHSRQHRHRDHAALDSRGPYSVQPGEPIGRPVRRALEGRGG
jgi:rubrerythrin